MNTLIVVCLVVILIGVFFYGRISYNEMHAKGVDHVGAIKTLFVFYSLLLKNGFPLAPFFIGLVIALNFKFELIDSWIGLLKALPVFIVGTITVRYFTKYVVHQSEKIIKEKENGTR